MKARSIAQSQKATTPVFTPVHGGVLQRKCACGGSPGTDGECTECRKKHLQRMATQPDGLSTVPPIVHAVLRSPGQPLEASTRAFMESRFGHNFGKVRIHNDAQAAASARAVNARAYTVGRDVVFRAGQYSPQTHAGREILAHELAHVVQQRGMTSGTPMPTSVSVPGDVDEREADTAASAIAQGFGASMVTPGRAQARMSLQRQLGEDDTQVPPTTQAPAVTQAQTNSGADTGTDAQQDQPVTGEWNQELMTILLLSDANQCVGAATPSTLSLYSRCGSPHKPACVATRVQFTVAFYVDRANAPRPQPFQSPTVKARFELEQGKNSQVLYDKTDRNPKYAGPNLSLEPNFGLQFPVNVDTDSNLKINLEMNDPAGIDVSYRDTVKFVVLCM
jgi:hypothetical protein